MLIKCYISMSYSDVCTQIRNSENKLSSVVIYSYYLSKLITFRIDSSKCNTILNILEIFTMKFANHYNRKKIKVYRSVN